MHVWSTVRPNALVLYRLALLVLGCVSCKEVPRSSLPPVREEARLRYARGEWYRRVGLEDLALDEFQAAIAADENCVEAHRDYQNILRGRCRTRELLDVYREKRERFPDSPTWHYLYGRMLVDPAEQRAAFAEAVRCDPSSFWGHYGLGYQAEVADDLASARAHYEKAIEIDPGSAIAYIRLGDLERRARRPEAAEARYRGAVAASPDHPDGYLGLATLLNQTQRGREALDVCLDAIRRRPPDIVSLVMLRTILLEHGTLIDFRETLDVLARAESLAPKTAALELVRALCHQVLGDSYLAIADYEAALAKGASRGGVAPALRLLHVKQHDYRAALADFEVTAPRALTLDPASAVRSRFEELDAATKEGAERPDDPAALRRLAEAYAAVGWIPEARAEYQHVLYLDPHDPRTRLGFERVERHERFVRKLRELVIDGYRQASSIGEETEFSASLDRALEEIETLAREVLDRDLSQPRRRRSYALIGSQLEPAAETDDALVSYFREWNQYFLLGRRSGSPTEAVLLNLLAVYPRRSRQTPEGDLVFEEVIGGSQGIPSLREFQGASLGGVTFEGMFVIFFDTVVAWQESAREAFRKFEPSARHLLEEPAEPARTTADRVRIGHTFCLEEKLYLRAYAAYLERRSASVSREEALAEDWRLYLSVVESHELGHLRDVSRFLPILAHPIRALLLLVGSGFSGARLEAMLEENAELTALASSESAYTSLGTTVSFLPFEDSGFPHSVAYARLLRDLVGEIARNPDRYASIEPSRNILQQLHRLSEDELRAAALRIAR